MTWKPSEGLRRAEPVVQTLLQDMATVGIHVTNPALRWRMVQVVSGALDHALADGAGAQRSAGFSASEKVAEDFPPSAGDELPYTNGHHEVEDSAWATFDQMPTVAVIPEELAAAIEEKQRRLDAGISVVAAEEPASAPVKRGRGRPKGSTGKKKKAARARARAAQEPKPDPTPVEVPQE